MTEYMMWSLLLTTTIILTLRHGAAERAYSTKDAVVCEALVFVYVLLLSGLTARTHINIYASQESIIFIFLYASFHVQHMIISRHRAYLIFVRMV